MHPTADTTILIFGYLMGRRVMPGVRFLLYGHGFNTGNPQHLV
jgi:hypothetical protein